MSPLLETMLSAAVRTAPLVLALVLVERAVASAAFRNALWRALALGVLLAPGALVLLPAVEWSRLPAVPMVTAAPAVSSAGAAVPSGVGTSVWTVVWLAGAGLLLLRLAGGMILARRWVRDARPSGREHEGGAAVLVSEAVPGPMTVGLLRPCILVPAAALEWSGARWRSVMLHEQAHVARRDVAWRFVGHALRVTQWFNPAAWWIGYRLDATAEAAADDAVVRAGVPGVELATHLLALAKTLWRSPPAAAVGMARVTPLSSRVRALLDARRPRLPVGAWARVAILSVTLALAGLLATGVAADPGDDTIVLSAGESRTLALGPVSRVAIGDPAVADVKVLDAGSEMRIEVHGLAAGKTTMLVWPAEGARRTFEISVSGAASAPTAPESEPAAGLLMKPGETVRLALPPTAQLKLPDRNVVETTPGEGYTLELRAKAVGTARIEALTKDGRVLVYTIEVR